MGKGGTGFGGDRYDRRERFPDCLTCTWTERWHRQPGSIPTVRTDADRLALQRLVTAHAFTAVCCFGATADTRNETKCETVITTRRMCEAHEADWDIWDDDPTAVGDWAEWIDPDGGLGSSRGELVMRACRQKAS